MNQRSRLSFGSAFLHCPSIGAADVSFSGIHCRLLQCAHRSRSLDPLECAVQAASLPVDLFLDSPCTPGRRARTSHSQSFCQEDLDEAVKISHGKGQF